LLDDLATDDAVLTCDSGTIATWAARHWTIRGSREFYLTGNLATMAPGLPYAIAIQHAHPGRRSSPSGGRRVRHADGRVPHRLPVPATRQGRDQQQLPRADPVGAIALAWNIQRCREVSSGHRWVRKHVPL
jgi:hypothetical protein